MDPWVSGVFIAKGRAAATLGAEKESGAGACPAALVLDLVSARESACV